MLAPLSFLVASLLSLTFSVSAFSNYQSLAGLSREQIHAFSRTFQDTPGAQPVPPPINDTSAKLVFDEAHPWLPLEPGDIRGPCPGLNTLASHGYLNRSGIVTPQEIITAVQVGFNMGWDLASFLTYTAFLVDGNHLTNLMSIGSKTPETGPDAPPPAIIGGLDTHGTVEGDASTTRDDAFLGNNYLFNETLFDQLEQAANDVGNGKIDVPSAALHRHNRILDSIARNPEFSFVSPRFFTAYGETTFPIAFFVNNQTSDSSISLGLDDARSFFQNSKFPDNFWRRDGAYDAPQAIDLAIQVYTPFPVLPGRNQGVGNYVIDLVDLASFVEGLNLFCNIYHKQANLTASFYPDPSEELRAALVTNLANYYTVLGDPLCEEVFPFGQN